MDGRMDAANEWRRNPVPPRSRKEAILQFLWNSVPTPNPFSAASFRSQPELDRLHAWRGRDHLVVSDRPIWGWCCSAAFHHL